MTHILKVLGIKHELRLPESLKNVGPVVYICNHQNSWDIFLVSAGLRPNTVTVGKKSLQWIPFFGQMYWLTGNVLIDRKDAGKAIDTINFTAEKIKNDGLSVWLFPEGTRSQGRGLLPFKTGAFRTALKAGVPIVPICVSNTHNALNFNRWDNGKVIIELLDPIYLGEDAQDNIRPVMKETRELMSKKIAEISDEIGNPLKKVQQTESE